MKDSRVSVSSIFFILMNLSTFTPQIDFDKDNMFLIRNGLLFLLMLDNNSKVEFKKELGRIEIDYLVIGSTKYYEDFLFLSGYKYLQNLFESFKPSPTVELMRKRELIGGLINILELYNYKCELYPLFSLDSPTFPLYNISSVETPFGISMKPDVLSTMGKEFYNKIVSC